MNDLFAHAHIAHQPHLPPPGDACERVLPRSAFAQAVAEISQWSGYAPTPLIRLPELAQRLGVAELMIKHEGPRFGLRSFKALGGAYAGLRILQREISQALGHDVSLADIRAGHHREQARSVTLISATDGNHGRSLAWGAQRFGAPCRIVIHAGVSEGRAQAMRDFGAEVMRIDGDYDASVAKARELAEANGWFVVSDTSWPGYHEAPRDVMAGYGVMAQEIVDALPAAPTHVLLQAGVGGLAAAVAAHFQQHWGEQAPRVIVVEPEHAACLLVSAQRDQATTVPLHQETVMAGLSCGEPSELAWAVLRETARDFVTVPDALVGPCVRLLARPPGDDPALEAGESAVAGLAVAMAACAQPGLREALGLDGDARVLLIGSEGVTDPEIFQRMMDGHDA